MDEVENIMLKDMSKIRDGMSRLCSISGYSKDTYTDAAVQQSCQRGRGTAETKRAAEISEAPRWRRPPEEVKLEEGGAEKSEAASGRRPPERAKTEDLATRTLETWQVANLMHHMARKRIRPDQASQPAVPASGLSGREAAWRQVAPTSTR